MQSAIILKECGWTALDFPSHGRTDLHTLFLCVHNPRTWAASDRIWASPQGDECDALAIEPTTPCHLLL